MGKLRFAYADPPYLGCCGLYQHRHEPPYGCWDEIDTHAALVRSLDENYRDGWAMSLTSPSLQRILPLCPVDVRVGSWVKPFASFKPGVNPAYAWEPVVFRGGRPLGRERPTVRDWLAHPITLRKGLTGAKPPEFCTWISLLLGYEDGDVLDDLFPGTGTMAATLAQGQIL